MSLLKTVNLEKNFGGVIAAKDINISIQEEEVVAVIGSNGAGKTTFVNMVTGYLKPSSGTIFFDGKDITGHNPKLAVAAGIHRSFQIPQLFMELSVIENILFALMVSKDKGKLKISSRALSKANIADAESILSKFSLLKHENEKVISLPQGVRKQLDIAMAAVGGPRMMMLDEPTSGVSTDEKMDMMDVIFEPLLADKTTILFIEHDMEIVQKYANRVIAFYEGMVLKDGSTDEVLKDPKVIEYIVGGAHA